MHWYKPVTELAGGGIRIVIDDETLYWRADSESLALPTYEH